MQGTLNIVAESSQERICGPSATRLAAIQAELLKEFRSRLVPLFHEQLRHARAEDTAELAVKQATHGVLAQGRIAKLLEGEEKQAPAAAAMEGLLAEACQWAASARCVFDCDRAAEYVAEATSETRRLEISGACAEEFASFLSLTMRAVLIERGKHPGERVIADFCQDVMGEVFNTAAFREIAIRYQPKLGKSFQIFVEQKLLWTCLRLVSGEEFEPEPLAPDLALPAAETAEADILESSAALGRISACFERLGAEERIVLELRQKAYLAPADMSTATREHIQAKTPGAWEQLETEFRASQDEHHNLVESRLGEAHGEAERCRYGLQVCEDRLAAWQLRRAEKDALARAAESRSLSELETGASGADRGGLEWAKAQFQLAWKRHREAVAAKERLLQLRESFQRGGTHWIRSDAEIGQLLGLSQPTVWRIRARAMKRLSRNHGVGKEPSA